jgi:hypothetical protein
VTGGAGDVAGDIESDRAEPVLRGNLPEGSAPRIDQRTGRLPLSRPSEQRRVVRPDLCGEELLELGPPLVADEMCDGDDRRSHGFRVLTLSCGARSAASNFLTPAGVAVPSPLTSRMGAVICGARDGIELEPLLPARMANRPPHSAMAPRRGFRY